MILINYLIVYYVVFTLLLLEYFYMPRYIYLIHASKLECFHFKLFVPIYTYAHVILSQFSASTFDLSWKCK